jgi:mono/diheme cytochrome c family protein
MRDPRVTVTSWVVMLVLLGGALLFATWRRVDAPPVDETRGGGARAAGRGAYDAECASCHPAASALSAALGPGGDWRPVAGLLLSGEAEFRDGEARRIVRRHPTFEHLSDERLAEILAQLAAARPPTAADIRSLRLR